MADIVYRDGNVSVAVSDGLEQLIRELIEDEHGHVLRAMEAEVDEARARVEQDWPVKTGESKAGFREVVEVGPGKLSMSLVNNVPYAQYVRARKQRARSFTKIVTKPAVESMERLAQRAREELKKVQRG